MSLLYQTNRHRQKNKKKINLMEVNRKTNNAHSFKTVGTDNTHLKL